MSRGRSLGLACVLAGGLVAVHAQGPEPIGAEFAVNSIESFVQDSSIAASPAGDFVVVWLSTLSPDPPDPLDRLPIDTDGSVQWRYFKAPGISSRPGQFQVNSYTTGQQGFPNAAFDAFGNFTVVWRTNSGNGDLVISGQRFAIDRTVGDVPFGGEVRLDAPPPGAVGGFGEAAMARLFESYGFVVVWPSTEGISGRRFSFNPITSHIVSLGDNFVVAEGDHLSDPDAAGADNGDFVVVWQEIEEVPGPPQISARLFDAVGAPRGEAFRVDSTPEVESNGNGPAFPAAGMAPDGAFVVFWSRFFESGPAFTTIFGQRFDANGTALGGELMVDDDPSSYALRSSVAVDRDGRFTVVWQQGLPEPAVFGRSYLATGQPISEAFELSSIATPGRILQSPSIAVDAEGDLFVSWTDDADNIHVRLFEAPGLFFADGFESGDTSSWSGSVP